MRTRRAASGVDTRFSQTFFGAVPEILVALDLPFSMVDGRITREMVRGSMMVLRAVCLRL